MRSPVRRPAHPRPADLPATPSLAGLPGALTSLIILWTGDYTPKVQWTLTVVILGFLLGFAASLRSRVVLPLQTLANLLAAMREDDFSIRGRTADPDDPLDAVLIEVNELAETLHEQRLGAVEATALLRTVMEQIDVAVFAFDPDASAAHRQSHRRAADGPQHGADARPHRRRARRQRLVRRCAARRRHLAAGRQRRAAGKCGGRRSGSAACRTTCWCCPTSAGRCASRSGRRGSG